MTMKISSIYGALSFISYKLGISVIPTRNLEDTAIVIERIAYREQIKDNMPLLSRKAPKEMAKKEGIDSSGYNLLFNVEKGGGQVIFHLHLHLLGGFK